MIHGRARLLSSNASSGAAIVASIDPHRNQGPRIGEYGSDLARTIDLVSLEKEKREQAAGPRQIGARLPFRVIQCIEQTELTTHRKVWGFDPAAEGAFAQAPEH